MKALLTRVVCSLSVIFLFTPAAFALVIDEFEGTGDLSTSVPFSPKSAVMAGTGIIGGLRKLYVEKTSAKGVIRLEVADGMLSHSQDATTTGNGRLVWDGTDNTAGIIAGLNGIDLLQDAGTAIELDVLLEPWKTVAVDLKVRLYDVDFGFSEQTVAFSNTSPTPVQFPFASFVGTADLTKIGAVELLINGSTPALDLTFEAIRTNGKCLLVPDANGKVIDQCGVCGGDNKSCADCAGIPNGTTKVDVCGVCAGNGNSCLDCLGVPFGSAVVDDCGVCDGRNQAKDDCGVCFGKNRNLDDCGVCGGSNLAKDLCGICGGNNSSCLDCAGIPNGKTVIDRCGVCGGNGLSCLDCKSQPFGQAQTDRCGVCEGDGRSCLRCVDTSLADLLAAMRKKSTEQERLVAAALKKLTGKKTLTFGKLTAKQSRALLKKLLDDIKKLPSVALSCESDLCVRSFENGVTIDRYKTNSSKLYRLVQPLVKLILRQMEGGVCGGKNPCPPTPAPKVKGALAGTATPTPNPNADCYERVNARRRAVINLQTVARRLYRQNITISKKIPRVVSKCE